VRVASLIFSGTAIIVSVVSLYLSWRWREPPFITKSGKMLTDADIQALANEAERGYDVESLRQRQLRQVEELRDKDVPYD
jgi:hypothetical protein